jgi:hypothetical protein
VPLRGGELGVEAEPATEESGGNEGLARGVLDADEAGERRARLGVDELDREPGPGGFAPRARKGLDPEDQEQGAAHINPTLRPVMMVPFERQKRDRHAG